MVDAGGQDDEVAGRALDPDPPVLLVPDVKVADALLDVADLLVGVNVLGEEALDLLLVAGQRVLGDLDAVLVVVAALLLDPLDVRREIVGIDLRRQMYLSLVCTFCQLFAHLES